MKQLLYSIYRLSDVYISRQQPAFYFYFASILLFLTVSSVYMNTRIFEESPVNCEQYSGMNSGSLHIRKKRGPPYLTYIMSSSPRRFNFTFGNLQDRVPNYFNVKLKHSVSINDSRIFYTDDIRASSLLLTYVDLWTAFGAQPETEYSDNDWVFLFEDDVDIVPYGIIERFYSKLFAQWNYSESNSSIAGSKNAFLTQ